VHVVTPNPAILSDPQDKVHGTRRQLGLGVAELQLGGIGRQGEQVEAQMVVKFWRFRVCESHTRESLVKSKGERDREVESELLPYKKF
jgi:hypothetical protein